MYYLKEYDSPVGKITIASDENSIKGLWIEGQKYFQDTVSSEIVKNSNLPVLVKTEKWLDRYFAGENPKLSEIPMAPNGSEFRQSVWEILCKIPYGEVITYGDIAKEIGNKTNKKMSGQAVGGAVGHNPISIIIPCHRVVGSNKSLTGYAGGINKKVQLLELEGIDISKYIIPTKGTAI